MKKAPTVSHYIGITTGKATIIKGKILEATVVDDGLSQAGLSDAAYACGGGGGCGGWDHRKAMAMQGTL